MQKESENKTYIKDKQATSYISKLFAFLKKQIKKSEDKVPKYLKGK